MEVLFKHIHAVSKYVYYCNGLFPISVYMHVRGHVGHIWGPRTYTYNRVQEVRGGAKCTLQATVTPSGGKFRKWTSAGDPKERAALGTLWGCCRASARVWTPCPSCPQSEAWNMSVRSDEHTVGALGRASGSFGRGHRVAAGWLLCFV
jgi:hypothetical protein